jgi:hypothetical protein
VVFSLSFRISWQLIAVFVFYYLANHLLGLPMSLFRINFNSNTLLGIKPTYDDTLPWSCNGEGAYHWIHDPRFKSGLGGRFLRVIEIHSTPSFGGEVRLENLHSASSGW